MNAQDPNVARVELIADRSGHPGFREPLVSAGGRDGADGHVAQRHAKANPNKLNYASYGSGSQPNLAMEMLKSQAGIEVVHVPYKGIPQAVPAAIAGAKVE